MLAHLADLSAGTDVPLNADFENGFGADAKGVAESVRFAVETGIAGVSIEDSVGPRLQRSAAATSDPLFDLEAAVERIRAARRAIDATGGDVMLIGRAECFLVGLKDIEATIARLVAYSNAGADCLYAPGIETPEHIRRVVEAVHPKPVNVLVMVAAHADLRELGELGVRRVSVGGALARAAWGGFMHAAEEIAESRPLRGPGGRRFRTAPECLVRRRLVREPEIRRRGMMAAGIIDPAPPPERTRGR